MAEIRFNALSPRNGGYAFLIRLDLMFSMSSIDFKLSIKHLIKLILYKNDVKLLKFRRSSVQVYL